jgi:predicted MFS family arabinose efflux permease
MRALFMAIASGTLLVALLIWIFLDWLRSKRKPPKDSNQDTAQR